MNLKKGRRRVYFFIK